MRPVIAAAGRVDLGRASELREVRDQRVLEQATVYKVFDECGVSLVVHGSDDVAHAFDGSKGERSVNVPGDFAKDRDEGIYGNEADPGFDEPPGEQAALADPGHPVALPDFLWLF